MIPIDIFHGMAFAQNRSGVFPNSSDGTCQVAFTMSYFNSADWFLNDPHKKKDTYIRMR